LVFFLFNFLISLGLGILDVFSGTMIGEGRGIISTFYSFAVFIPSLAVLVRRMHDVGKSGWYCLIPIYNLILCCTEGEHKTNEYGPDPKAVQHHLV